MLTVIVRFNGLNLKQNKMNIVRQVSFESANRKKDRSVSIRFTTDIEQSTEEFMEIDTQSVIMLYLPVGLMRRRK
jgi:hypothetical protein